MNRFAFNYKLKIGKMKELKIKNLHNSINLKAAKLSKLQNYNNKKRGRGMDKKSIALNMFYFNLVLNNLM